MVTTKPVRVDSCAWYPYSEAMRKSLLRASRFEEEVDVTTADLPSFMLGVPREMVVYPWRGSELDNRSWGVDLGDPEFEVNPEYPPRNTEQSRVIAVSSALLEDDQSHIVEASTGFGKTFCALNIIANTKLKTLIVVTKEDLMESWPKEAMKFLSLKKSDIGFIQQGKYDVDDKKIVIAMVHSLAQREYPPEVTREFGLVVFDEVHHMAAETFSTVAAMFGSRLRLGFSATPKRLDGKDFVFHGHIGKVMVQAKLIPVPPKVLVKRTGWRLPRIMDRDSGEVIQLPHEAGKLMHVITRMAKDTHRNQMIVKYAVQAYKKDRWTVVLSDLAEDKHLGILRKMCQDAGVPSSDMAYYKGGMNKKEREVAITKRLVFATYGMTGEATDVPWWDLVILATPRANVVQAVGRVLREYPGKPRPVVIDLVDDDSEILNGYFKSRVKQYTSSEMKGEVIYL